MKQNTPNNLSESFFKLEKAYQKAYSEKLFQKAYQIKLDELIQTSYVLLTVLPKCTKLQAL